MSELKERPILFSAPMVRALLDGTKTQTRRTNGLSDVNANPGIWVPTGCFTSDGFGELGYMAKKSVKGRPGATFRTSQLADRTLNICPQVCPYGKPGDRLWARETWGYRGTRWDSDTPELEKAFIQYRADGVRETISLPNGTVDDIAKQRPRSEEETENQRNDYLERYWKKWRPSIHMPRWASRITLEVTEVRVQRLQEISGHDAHAEGFGLPPFCADQKPGTFKMTEMSMIDNFATYWRKLNGDESWDTNPWVWAVRFKRVQP